MEAVREEMAATPHGVELNAAHFGCLLKDPRLFWNIINNLLILCLFFFIFFSALFEFISVARRPVERLLTL